MPAEAVKPAKGADRKTHIVVAEREGAAPRFVRVAGRDGSWTMTFDRAQARRFTPELAEAKASAMHAACTSRAFSFRAEEA